MSKDELKKISGIGEVTLEKLKEMGIETLLSLATQNPADLANKTGVSEKICRKFISEANELCSLGFETATDYFKKKESNKKISTGCDVFDTMLEGGFESGGINEIHGRTGLGKTQLAHLMVVRALVEDKKGKAIYIDTENTFKIERVRDFAEANGLKAADVLQRISVARAYSFDNQILLINKVEEMLQKDNTYKILVIDSLTAHMRSEFAGRGQLADRQAKLNKHMHDIMRIADIYNLVVVATNQIMSDPAAMFANPDKPVGGNILTHNCSTMIYLRGGLKGCTHATVVDSSNLPKNSCDFFITKTGFVDFSKYKPESKDLNSNEKVSEK